jgi:hypothetical protein
VTINFQDMPIKGMPLFNQWFQRHNFVDATVSLDIVVV